MTQPDINLMTNEFELRKLNNFSYLDGDWQQQLLKNCQIIGICHSRFV
jgi:hypothetical protein